VTLIQRILLFRKRKFRVFRAHFYNNFNLKMAFNFNTGGASSFNFGAASSSSAPNSASAPNSFSFASAPAPGPAPAPAGSFSFGGAAAAGGSAFGGGFFSVPTSQTSAPPASNPPQALSFSLSTPAAPSAAPASASTTTTTASTAPSPSSAASAAIQKAPVEKPLEDAETLVEIMKRWKSEVEIQKEEFIKQSKQVIEWDTSLRSARVGLTRLSDDVARLNREQEDIESSLSHVGNHNTRLKNMLEEIERYLDFRLGAGQNGEAPESASQATAQAARAEAYDAARRIESLLSLLGDELHSVNDLISKGLSNQIENPLDKAKIVLAAEVNNLGDIERASNEVYERAKKLRAQAQMYSKM
jgi:hypothetical protein